MFILCNPHSAIPKGRFYLHFADEEIEAQRGVTVAQPLTSPSFLPRLTGGIADVSRVSLLHVIVIGNAPTEMLVVWHCPLATLRKRCSQRDSSERPARHALGSGLTPNDFC